MNLKEKGQMEMKKKKFSLKGFLCLIFLLVLAVLGFKSYQFYQKFVVENKILKEIISRLEAESRAAEVLVTNVEYNPITQKHMTTIKFLEYDSRGEGLTPKYFTFAGNLIQFQSLIVRFEDVLVRAADKLKGKSAYLFWKVFILDGAQTQEYEITKVNTVPEGYKIPGGKNAFEEQIWREFWEYALDPKKAKKLGIKNAQIEAPGTKFVPGMLYTLKIEHDGGLRIDVSRIPEVLRGEKI